jgi:hypothetical protein
METLAYTIPLTLAASSLIILLSDMLKISPKKTIEENKIVKENMKSLRRIYSLKWKFQNK